MENYKVCPECSKNVFVEDTVCDNCGYPFLPSEMIVTEEKQQSEKNQKQKIIALSSVLILSLVFIGYFVYTNAKNDSMIQNKIESSPISTTLQTDAQEQEVSDKDLSIYKYVSALTLNIRKSPNTTSEVIKELKFNDKVEFLSKNNDIEWSKVKLETGEMGWASSAYLSPAISDNKIFFDDKCVLINQELFCIGDDLKSNPPKYYYYKSGAEVPQGTLIYTIHEKPTEGTTEASIIAKDDSGRFLIDSIGLSHDFSGQSEYGFSAKTTCTDFIEILKSNKLKYIAFNDLKHNPPTYKIFAHGSDLKNANHLVCNMKENAISGLSLSASEADYIDILSKRSERVYFNNEDQTVADAPPGPATITGGENNFEEKAVRDVLSRWQTVKRDAFLQGSTSELSSILSGAALTETQGGVEWWSNPENGSFRDIQLHSLKIESISFPQSTQAIAKVTISETKDNSVQGRKTSNYSATYELTKTGESWYISGIKAD